MTITVVKHDSQGRRILEQQKRETQPALTDGQLKRRGLRKHSLNHLDVLLQQYA